MIETSGSEILPFNLVHSCVLQFSLLPLIMAFVKKPNVFWLFFNRSEFLSNTFCNWFRYCLQSTIHMSFDGILISVLACFNADLSCLSSSYKGQSRESWWMVACLQLMASQMVWSQGTARDSALKMLHWRWAKGPTTACQGLTCRTLLLHQAHQ